MWVNSASTEIPISVFPCKSNVSRALDCGVTGVMVPMVKNGEEARRFADWAKFAPTGQRGLGGSGAHTEYLDAAKNPEAFMRQENENILTIAQIELSEAIDNIEDITATEGIDALLIGPADLSNSLGVSGQFNHPKMDEAIAKVAAAAKKHHKIFGFHAGEELTRKWMPHGLTLRMSLMDINLLTKGMAAITSLRD